MLATLVHAHLYPASRDRKGAVRERPRHGPKSYRLLGEIWPRGSRFVQPASQPVASLLPHFDKCQGRDRCMTHRGPGKVATEDLIVANICQ